MKPELKQFIKNLESEDVESLFAIQISKNVEPNLQGAVHPYVTSVTFIPPHELSEDDNSAIRQYLWCIADIIKDSFDDE